MRRALLSILILSMGLTLLGNPVDENTAKQLAQNFWKENNITDVRGEEVFKIIMDDARFVNVATRCGYSEFYIFNNEDGKGFVIIAADDCVTPVLGYSYDNNFSTGNLPPNLKGWLDGYAEQIRAAVEMRAAATEEIRTEWECLRQGRNLPIKSETEVDHLLSTTWSQGEYYNMLCPEDNNGINGHAVTGCVATAMAQILKFWEYPNEAHRVIWHEYEHPDYGTLDANYTYAGGSYYWNFMPNQLTSSSSTNQKIAVASLMYHCGVSVEMNYGPTESLANAPSAEIAFRAFFDYNNATLVTRLSNDTQWINLLKNEIDNGRPVYYAGTDPDGKNGHAFVCDGYDNNNFFWFNWGFGGLADGSFTVNSLTPTIAGYQFDFSNNQHAIIGIEPGGTNSYHLLDMNDDIKLNGYYGDIYCFDTQIQEITTEVYNWGNTAFTGSLCAVVFDGERQYMAESEFINNCQIPPMQSSGQLSFTFSEPLNILPCKAEVRIYSIENNQPSLVYSYGMHPNPSEFYNYYTNSSDMVELYLYSNIEYSPCSIVQNSAINVTANITNDDNDPNLTFYGYYAAALYDLNGELKQILTTLHEVNGLPSGYHYTSPLTFSCPSVNVPTGTYYLTIIQQSEGSDNWYPLLNWEDCVNPEYVNPIRVEVVNSITATANPNNGGTVTCNKTMIAEDFESYPTANNIATAAHAVGHNYWTTWNDLPGSSEDGLVDNLNGNQCGHFTYGNDQLLLINNVNSGAYDIKFDILVPQGKNGYFTILHHFADSNSIWAMQCYLHLTNDGQTSTSAPGHGTLHAGSNSTADIPCVYDEWMHFRIHVNTDEDVAKLYFNVVGQPENMYAEWQWSLDSFGSSVSNYIFDALDFFPPYNTASEFYVDNIVVSKQTNNYFYGDICNVTATPNSGYTFTNWTENGTQVSTNPNYNFTVTGNRNLVANFQAQQYTISITPNPSNGGSVSGGGTYNHGQSCTVNATVNPGYTFINWTENGTQVSNNPNYTFTVTGNRNLVANFQIQQHTISVTPNPSYGGSVSGGGTYNHGQSCTVSASVNEGHAFVSWTENGIQVSTNPNYTFTVTGNRNLVANFQALQYTISVTPNPSYGGSVSGGGTFNYGQSCTVNAVANSGYTFVNWTENGTQVSTNANYTFIVSGNRSLVANFTSQSYVITATTDPSTGGFVTGSGGYNYGETCTITATANTGYTFLNWTKNGTQVSANPSYSFTVTESATYTAHFNAQSYTISVAANPNNAGSVSGGGSYTYGQTCTVTASANNGYAFTSWSENGTQVSTNVNYSFTVTGNRNLVANFVPNTHTIQATAGSNGTITPSGNITVALGANQSFSMIPDAGYEVQEVYIDGNPVGAMNSYTFTNVTADHYIHVNFTLVDAIGENNTHLIQVYPNPTMGEVIIEAEGLSHIRIVNLHGQTVYNTNVVDELIHIDLSQMAKGVYLMHIEAKGRQVVRKIVVE